MTNTITKSKDDIILMVAELKAKKNAALRTKRNATLEQRASVDRTARNLQSVCDRLVCFFNMHNDVDLLDSQRNQAAVYFENTLAEAELWLTE